MLRPFLFGVVLVSSVALAQGGPIEPRVVVVPYPGDAVDAGAVATPPPAPPLEVSPPPVVTTPVAVQPPAPPPPAPAADVPPAEPMGPRTINAVTPSSAPLNEPAPVAMPESTAPGAFLDGHPRTGAFLSGPGSFTFLMHHTIMGGVGLLATQFAPRVGDAAQRASGEWIGQDARVAYLAGTLIGAGLGFGTSAWWQFNHWVNTTTATFGIINGLVGGMFLAGVTNLFTENVTALSWTSFIGLEIGSWITALIAGGDMPLNQGTLIASGAGWAAIYSMLFMAILGSVGVPVTARGFFDAMLITPALGAAAMWAATLKFNPSTMQIMRANLFGLGVGGAVLVLSALALGFNFVQPIPYLLGGLGAIGAKTVVSLLWAEAAEPGKVALCRDDDDYDAHGRYRNVWW